MELHYLFIYISLMLPSGKQIRKANLTWMENVAHGAIVKDHDFAEVRLDLSKIFDISPVAECAVLSIISSCEILALYL